MLTFICLLLIISLAGNGLQAIYASKLRHELLRCAKECYSWKLAARHYEQEAHR